MAAHPRDPNNAMNRYDTTTPWTVRALDRDGEAALDDVLVREEPLAIAVARPGETPREAFTTLRTPGRDHELAAGWMATEGLVTAARELLAIVPVTDPQRPLHQRLVVGVGPSTNLDGLGQLGWASSACGVCGRTAIGDIVARARPHNGDVVVPFEVLTDLPRRLADHQQVFDRTGAIHAAAIFDGDGNVLAAAEDIGRHNAVDKAVGELLLAGDRHTGSILLTSGRAGFEIVAKAARRGIAIVAAVGAPSDLSVQLAQAVGMSLVGFLRDGRANVYTHTDRIVR